MGDSPRSDIAADGTAAALEVVCRLGSQMFRAGFETRAIEVATAGCGSVLGLRDIEIDINGRSFHIQARSDDGRPIVRLAVVRTVGGYDLHQMKSLNDIITDILEGSLTARQAGARLDAAMESTGPWPWWINTCGGAVLAASITLQSRGTPVAALLAMIVLVVVNRGGWLLTSTGAPRFFVYIVQGGVAVLAGLACVGLSLLPGNAAASLVAANLVLLLPMPAIVAVAEDAITGYNITAASRAVTVLLAAGGAFTGVILVGIVVGEQTLANTTTSFQILALSPLLSIAAAAVGGVGNGFFMNGGARLIVPAALVATAAATVNLFARTVLALPGPLATGIAAIVLGVLAVLIGKVVKIPATEMIMTGITGALLPGLDIYQALIRGAAGLDGAWAALLASMVTTSAIGAGVVLGVFFAARRLPASLNRIAEQTRV